jgi:uncharacterized protein (DUF111 family)
VEPLEELRRRVDDLDPQLWPSVPDAVRAAGAWDCWTSPVAARHGRPGHVLTAVRDATLRAAVADAVFRHTTTIGLRWSRWHRETLLAALRDRSGRASRAGAARAQDPDVVISIGGLPRRVLVP